MSIQTPAEPIRLPLLALRGLVIFPDCTLHFDVGRKRSVSALSAAMNSGHRIMLVAQKNSAVEDPEEKDLYKIGCVARIRQTLRLPDGTVHVVAEGLYRAEITKYLGGKHFLTADVAPLKIPTRTSENMSETLLRRIKDSFRRFSGDDVKITPEMAVEVEGATDIGKVSDFIAFNLLVPEEDKQRLLELRSPVSRAKLLLKMLDREFQILELNRSINDKVKMQLDKNQRDYYLRELAHSVNTELYGDDSEEAEIDKYYEKIAALDADDSVKERLKDETAQLAKMPQGSHNGTVSRLYLDTCLSLPWRKVTKTKADIKAAERVLERDFYGLAKVKERILELISVYKLNPDISGQILCIAGPPGVGKTHLAKSVAECMGRKYARLSLGGVNDESEIRGHRKTYIGAMPGRIISAISRAGSSNPLILLDELDKLSKDYKGDPASALLEVLDPEQNATFTDHFIDMPYDLSKVVFIATANDISRIPEPLLDRLELIELAGYTEEEKLCIAKRHLIKKQLQRHNIAKTQLKFTDNALRFIINRYTREAGVRELERVIASLCRKAAKEIVLSADTKITLTEQTVRSMLGAEKYHGDFALEENAVGVINGLAWTAAGGRLMGLEVLAVDGTGKLELTGSLGDVMKESAKSAVTYVRSKAAELGIDPLFYKNKDIHIHATESATPKDGPSAGVAITSALISALTGRNVRSDIALTGEVSIRGRVFPIGGLKEKAMAAMRNRIPTVLIPFDNIPDLEEVDPAVKQAVTFIPCKTMDDVLSYALEPIAAHKQDFIPKAKDKASSADVYRKC